MADEMGEALERAKRFFGTWVLDVTRSKYVYGDLPRSATMTIEPAPGGLRIRLQAVGSRGTPFTMDGTWPFADTERNRTVLADERTLVHTLKQDGVPTSEMRRELNEAGTELTTRHEGSEDGEPWVNVSVFVRGA